MKPLFRLALFAALGALFALVMERPRQPLLLVYLAVPDAFSVVAPGPPARVVRTFDCVKLGRWAVLVGTRDGLLVALDAEHRALATVPLETLRRLADGRETCDGRDRVRRVELGGRLPYRGLLDGDRLYVSYFAGNLVEAYRWPGLERERAIDFAAGRNLGLSDLLRWDDAVVVAAAGYHCFARDCPEGRLGESALFFVRAGARWPLPSLVPANRNAATLYRHAPTGAVYVVSAGEFDGGRGGLQRLQPGPALGPPIWLPVNAATAAAYPLGPDLFAIAQFAGPHLFLVDAREDRLVGIQRLDQEGFTSLPLDTGPLPDRTSVEIQAIVPDPAAPDRFYLVDAKGERLIHAARRARRLELLSSTSLETRAFRTNPHWAVWLR